MNLSDPIVVGTLGILVGSTIGAVLIRLKYWRAQRKAQREFAQWCYKNCEKLADFHRIMGRPDLAEKFERKDDGSH